MDLLGDAAAQKAQLSAHLTACGHHVRFVARTRVVRLDCTKCDGWAYWQAAQGLAWGTLCSAARCGEGRWAQRVMAAPGGKTDAVTGRHGDTAREDE